MLRICGSGDGVCGHGLDEAILNHEESGRDAVTLSANGGNGGGMSTPAHVLVSESADGVICVPCLAFCGV